MQPKSIRPVVFSPTGTSRKSAEAIARGIARTGGAPSATPEIRTIDLTHTAAAETLPADAVALFAVPVYGGHVPSLALKRMEGLRGSGTPAVLLVVYGNRAFEHAAAELAAFVSERGFVPVAAGAFVGEHSYSTPQQPIAAGRPDEKDIAEAEAFGEATGRKLATQGIAAIDVARLKDVRTPLIPLLRFIRFCPRLPAPAEETPRGTATRMRRASLRPLRTLRRTMPHRGHRPRRGGAHRPGPLHPLLRLRQGVPGRSPAFRDPPSPKPSRGTSPAGNHPSPCSERRTLPIRQRTRHAGLAPSKE